MKQGTRTHFRKIPLTVGSALSLLAYEAGERRSFPEWAPPFDMDEHASHFAPGMAVGFVTTYICTRMGVRISRGIASGVAATAIIGSLFETGIFDGVYRNTTHSPSDAAWTTIAGLYGALCVRGSMGQVTERNSDEESTS